jgi:peptidyl-prolyl cis-trans isomerase C
MSLTKTGSKFLVFFLIFFLSAALIWAGGKQEKPGESETVSDEAVQSQSETIQSGSESEKIQGTPIGANNEDAVATVNGIAVSREDFEQLLNYAQYQYMQQGMQIQPGPQLEQLKAAVLESLIDDELLYQIALDEGYAADDEEVAEKLALTKQQVGSEENFEQILEQQGLTEDDLKRELRKTIVRDNFMSDRFISTSEVSAEEAKEFYDQNAGQFTQPFQFRSSHILIQVAEDASEEEKSEAMKKILEAKSRIDGGEEFSEVARELSDCPSGKNGGDLNYNAKGAFVPAFEEAALGLEIGEISDVVETQFGYHLIRLTDIQEEQTLPFAQVETQINDYLLRIKAQEKRNNFLNEKKPGAEIQRKLGNG